MKLLPAFTDLHCSEVKGINEGTLLSVCLFCSLHFYHYICFFHYLSSSLFLHPSLCLSLSSSVCDCLFVSLFILSLSLPPPLLSVVPPISWPVLCVPVTCVLVMSLKSSTRFNVFFFFFYNILLCLLTKKHLHTNLPNQLHVNLSVS